MKRIAAAFAVLASLVLAACTATTSARAVTVAFTPPPAGSTVILVEPDVRLSVLTAVGVPERRADWSEAGQRHILAASTQFMTAQGYQTVVVDPDAVDGGQQGQVLRLFEQVAASIFIHHYGPFPLPSMQGRFYSLGRGVRSLASDHEAGYALFVYAEGCYSSGGRMAVVVLAAVAGASLPTCQQQLIAALVSIETGNIEWFNFAVAGTLDDMREETGARTLVTNVFRGAPL